MLKKEKKRRGGTKPRILNKLSLFMLVMLVGLSPGITCFAQYGETIRSARPGQTIGPYTTGARVFQVQSGFELSGFENTQNAIAKGKAYTGVCVFRFGLTERFEVAAGVAYRSDEPEQDSLTTKRNGISALSVRMRSNINVGEGWVPTLGWQLNLGLPILSEDYAHRYVAPKITLIIGQKLGKRFGLTANLGAAWNGNNASPRGFYTLNLGYAITNRFRLFAEHYGFMQDGDWDGKFDGGFAYLLTNDLQFDLSGGYGRNDRTYSDWFITGGVSWRVRFNKKEKNDN